LYRGFGAWKSRVGTRLNAQPRAAMRGKQRIIKQSGRNFQSRGGAPLNPPYSAPAAARPGLTVARGRGMRMWYSAIFHRGLACKRCPSKALNRI